ncbi:MAG: F0F1 ATP synthase subunit B [Candidatus Liptonbacteria bacterium]|nr:F0F1 ATP synthase subunit B [Candidatus Liptonbacteria bacterium]
MSQVLGIFGVDWRLLLINAINFGLLLIALRYFIYGPIMKMLEGRREKVAEGVKAAELAGKKLAETEASRAGVLARAGKEADELLSHGRESGLAKEKELIAEGEAAADSLIKDAENQAKEIKDKAIAESKEEVAKLIVLGMEKIIKERK